ncbi:hypothetical protein BsWGS_27860 [Bradybaena similaris]
MASVVLKALGLTLGLFFIFVGTIKLTPSVNADIYKEMRKTYIRNSKVFPLVKQTGWKPNPHTYRKTVGSTELICGASLAFLPGPLKEAANICLLLLTLNDIYAHFALDEGLDKMGPAFVFSLLLSCRLVIYLQGLAAAPKSVFNKSQLESSTTCNSELVDERVDDKKDQ